MRLRILPETPSTMADARAALEAGEGVDAILALKQTAGKGRLGRPWLTFDAPHSMACTYIIQQNCAHLPLVAALAVREALVAEGVEGLTLKWPNDVLKNGQKLAGILCESTPKGALVGIGLNLNPPPEPLPAGFTGAFANLTQSPENMAEKIGTCLFVALVLYQTHGWPYFTETYAKTCITFGQTITWRGVTDTDELTGLARGLNTSGHLEVVADDGTVHVISGGDIIAQATKTPA
jgi:BirA family transcriptional regulator, biotin operon repressor / biotin---[acetyl-CoA-carboxylase] ligase